MEEPVRDETSASSDTRDIVSSDPRRFRRETAKPFWITVGTASAGVCSAATVRQERGDHPCRNAACSERGTARHGNDLI
jgi:hypothetical protein